MKSYLRILSLCYFSGFLLHVMDVFDRRIILSAMNTPWKIWIYFLVAAVLRSIRLSKKSNIFNLFSLNYLAHVFHIGKSRLFPKIEFLFPKIYIIHFSMVLILQGFYGFNERPVEMFNTLKYTKQLEEVGLTREQAEAHINIMTEFDNRLDAFEAALNKVQQTMDSGFQRIDHEMKQLKSDLILSLGTIVLGGLGALTAVIKFFLL